MPKIEALMPLQQVDQEIHRLRMQRDEKPRALAPLEARLARAKENLEGVRAEIKALKLEGQKREHSVKELEDKIQKLQAQANMARKNDEYQAFQKEISGIKADKQRIEDGLLDIYMQVDEKGKLEKVRDSEVKAADGECAIARKQNEAEIAELDRKISELAARREELAGAVDRELLARYDRVLRVKDDGVALAPIVIYESIEDEGVRKYWGCGGCSVGVTSQDVNEVRRAKDILSCRSCSRLLYWPEEGKAS
ncbi:MAG: hypothetical protein HYY16_06345 [Planctomycetes bacterium]|nr:hypothetical protein [Planctomycetota bacterium]